LSTVAFLLRQKLCLVLYCVFAGIVIPATTGCAGGRSFTAILPDVAVTQEQKNITHAEHWFIRAQQYMLAGNEKKALRCYEKAYRYDPASETLRSILIEFYTQNARFEQALNLVIGNKTADSLLTDDDKRLCAKIYLRMNKNKDAVAMLTAIKNKRPDEQYVLGFAHESAGDIPGAIEYYRAYLDSNTESTELWLKIGAMYVQTQQYAAAESLFDAMETQLGKSAQTYSARANVNLLQGDTLKAVRNFESAVHLDSTDAEPCRSLARIYLRKGNYALSTSWYERLRICGKLEVADGKMLAMLYFYLGRFDRAKPLLSELLDSNANDLELHYNYGLILASTDSIQAARAEYEKTIAINKLFPEAWMQLCFLALQEKNDSLAHATIQRFKQAMPEYGGAWRIDGSILNAQKQYDRARLSLEKAVGLDSNDAAAWFELGVACERISDRKSAETSLRHVLRMHPRDPAASNFLGYMWVEDGLHLDSAKILIEAALAQDPKSGAYLDSYAWVWFKMGVVDSAAFYIQQALKAFGDDPVLQSHYAEILEKQGNRQAALAAYRKSLELSGTSVLSEKEVSAIRMKMEALIRVINGSANTMPEQREK